MSYGLEDCGKEVEFRQRNVSPGFPTCKITRTIEMVIKTPRGTLVIYHDRTNCYRKAGKAIKAFMNEHKHG